MPEQEELLEGKNAGHLHIQPQLTVGPADDLYEQEADRVANTVMRMPEAEEQPNPKNQNPNSEHRHPLWGRAVQVFPITSLQRFEADSSVEQRLSANRGTGHHLPDAVRGSMESKFDANFSGVRVHTGGEAAQLNRELRAQAFTHGGDIYFGEGKYNPASSAGQHLLAHELTHVVQQGAASAPATHIQRFEAPIHESAERVGLTTDAKGGAGGNALSNEEASAVYFGNWMRDINQVFVPLVKSLMPDDMVFSFVNYMAARKFGREVTPEQFGYYIPAEHIDSPAGLTEKDDLLQPKDLNITAPTVGAGQPRPAQYVTPQESPEPGAKVGGGPLFAADQSAVAAWIRRTNVHVERHLELAAKRGRNPEGLMHFGAALHPIEDLYSHSNWIEIAINRIFAQHSELLPDLKGEDRKAFTYAPTVTVGKTAKGKPEQRPVLMTGSFTGIDTQISITSEVVKMMSHPLPPPGNNAEAQAEERFMAAFLRASEKQLKGNDQFRTDLRNVIVRQLPPIPGRETIVDGMLQAPLEDIYNMTRMPHIPDWVKERTTRPIQNFIRQHASTQVLRPTAAHLQAKGLGARIYETSLIGGLRGAQATQQGQFSGSDVEMQRAKERLTGTPVAQQQKEAVASAGRHVAALQGIPEPVIAGPSHSQIAKDHPDSPFFGLAFKLAAMAVRAVREKMVAAWGETAGAPTKPFSFEFANFPPASQPEAQNLFHATRPRRTTKEQESLKQGQTIVQHGNLEPKPYDLAEMRKESADRIRAAADILRGIAGGPDATATGLARVYRLLGNIPSEFLAPVRTQIARTAAASQTAGMKLNQSVSFSQIAANLDRSAGMVENARLHKDRDAANQSLVAERAAALQALANTPSVNTTLAASVLVLLDQEISRTAVAFTAEQQAVVQGKAHVAEHTGPKTMPVAEIKLPDVNKDFEGKTRTPAVVALIQESRTYLSHPYDVTWWQTTLIEHIKANEKQIRTDLEARNQGVGVYYRAREIPGQHEH